MTPATSRTRPTISSPAAGGDDPADPAAVASGPPDAPAASISKSGMRNLQKQAEAQVKQCWHVPKSRTSIATTVRVHYNPGGSVAGEPDVVRQTIAPEYYVVVVREIAQRAKRG